MLFTVLLVFIHVFATCKYGFRDAAPIPTEIKTFRVNYFDNRAQYINSRLSPELTEKLKQKIINTTRLRQTNSEDAHYDISGFVSQYYTTTTGISGNNAGTNRLHVGFRLIFRNTLDPTKDFEADLSRTFDFSANQSLDQAENTLNDEIISNLVDEIFNRIFSNW
jgi:outer membrane lipopolysaccharide assembly protein LptE/RlpB